MGTFRIVNGNKQGGNVAAYFCLGDGTVVHAVAGQLNAVQFLREAKWAVEVRKLAMSEASGDLGKYRATVRKAHLERLSADSGMNLPPKTLPIITTGAPPVPTNNQILHRNGRGLGNQGQVHVLLAYTPLPKIQQLYPIVFQDILKEKLSTLPVATK